MSRNLLIRNVPEKLGRWIETERRRQMMSQQEFMLAVLEKARNRTGRPALSEEKPPAPPAPLPGALPFTFVDLFAGIGGFRIGLERVGGRSVFSCEWDQHAQRTYRAWFGETPHGDIRKIKPKDIPDHDVLAAGFPCQPFSLAGVSKKNSLGRQHGFRDKTQGTLFFHLATIAEIKRPPVLLLENVKNLLSHDKGRTWEVIRSTLEGLNYRMFHRVLDAKACVPQHRERVFIVCFDRKVFGDNPPFEFPPLPERAPIKFGDILEPNPDPRYTLSDHLWKYLKKYAEKHRRNGNGFGFGLADLKGITRTMSARYHKDGSEILIPQKGRRNPRRMTPREAARLLGFPDNLPIVVSDTQAYRQFGNAVVPAMVEAVGLQIVKVLDTLLTRRRAACLVKGRFD